jgi:hypothetical protein
LIVSHSKGGEKKMVRKKKLAATKKASSVKASQSFHLAIKPVVQAQLKAAAKAKGIGNWKTYAQSLLEA